MEKLDTNELAEYVSANIGPCFHQKKIDKIERLTLDDIIKRKNPYLFKAKNILSAGEYIKAILDATVSSGEETIFGNFLEQIAIFVCEKVYQGHKSGTRGIDLEFEYQKTRYLISIKSGPNWGNSSQIKKMEEGFISIQKTLKTSGGMKAISIVCVEGCCYGNNIEKNKGVYVKLCGQAFWKLISGGNANLYIEIIQPLGFMAKQYNETINDLSNQKLNLFTGEFINRFCDNGLINWQRLVEFNSGSV